MDIAPEASSSIISFRKHWANVSQAFIICEKLWWSFRAEIMKKNGVTTIPYRRYVFAGTYGKRFLLL